MDGGCIVGRYVVGLSGASGIVYGVRAVETLAALGHELHLVVSKGAPKVAHHEMSIDLEAHLAEIQGNIVRYRVDDTAARPASGSFLHDGMLVIPASLRTMAAVSHGLADNLLTRAAIVTLKESRPLVLVPRENPLDLIALRNWTSLKEAGARLAPAMPGFYHRPRSIDDLVNHVVGKALDQLGVTHELYARWDPERPRDE